MILVLIVRMVNIQTETILVVSVVLPIVIVETRMVSVVALPLLPEWNVSMILSHKPTLKIAINLAPVVVNALEAVVSGVFLVGTVSLILTEIITVS